MIGLGTIINSAAIIAGGLIGHFTGSCSVRNSRTHKESMWNQRSFYFNCRSNAGNAEVDGAKFSAGNHVGSSMSCIGYDNGQLIGIEAFRKFGSGWQIGGSGDKQVVNTLSASLTVCIGAMAIVGAMQDGVSGDYSILVVKSVLDFIIIVVMTSSFGKGCAFSAIPVFLFEGVITLLARLISPMITETAIAYLSLIGSVLIFCVGLNLVWGKKVRVANMLPALIFAVVAAYLPWSF